MSPAPPLPALCAAASLGGLLGALLRWQVGVHLPDGSGFPWTTLGINVSGSLLLAALPAVDAIRRHPVLPVFLGTGVLGGYTTLSAYAEQGRGLFADGEPFLGGCYLAVTLLACVAAVSVAHWLSSPEEQDEFAREEGNE